MDRICFIIIIVACCITKKLARLISSPFKFLGGLVDLLSCIK